MLVVARPCQHPTCWISALCFTVQIAGAKAGTHQIDGRIVGITDGDTITLLEADYHQHKIRLDGIDAPESKQPFGNASKRSLSDLAYNRDAVAECHKPDRYGREVCRVIVGGIDVCQEQLRAGMAWVFTRYANELPRVRRKQYTESEKQAKGERRGLWADAQPVPPWEWRRDKANQLSR